MYPLGVPLGLGTQLMQCLDHFFFDMKFKSHEHFFKNIVGNLYHDVTSKIVTVQDYVEIYL